MLNPKDVLTQSGYSQYTTHLINMENALDFVLSHASDLELGIRDKHIGTLQAMRYLLRSKFLLNGDSDAG